MTGDPDLRPVFALTEVAAAGGRPMCDTMRALVEAGAWGVTVPACAVDGAAVHRRATALRRAVSRGGRMITCCDCVSWNSISVTWNSPSPVERPSASTLCAPSSASHSGSSSRGGAVAPGRCFGMYCDDGIHGRK